MIILGMLTHNDANRYLSRVLDQAQIYADGAVVIDDCSTDNTISILSEGLRRIYKGFPNAMVCLPESYFHREGLLRKILWDNIVEIVKKYPRDEINLIFLDSDEVFEEERVKEIRDLVEETNSDVWLFRLYDMWDSEEYYRDDDLWCAHRYFHPLIFRYYPGANYCLNLRDHHCGRVPANLLEINRKWHRSDIRVKHLGWLKPEERINKYHRYLQMDPNGIYGSMKQYQSILDRDVKLSRWSEYR